MTMQITKVIKTKGGKAIENQWRLSIRKKIKFCLI